jgi:hypothetical protein
MAASYLRKYGTGTGADIYINIPKAGSANHAVSADWTPAAGDVKVSKDGAAAANIGTLPTAIAMGNSTIWKFVFTDAELQAAFVSVTVSDSATKAVDDTGFSIETYGNASAQHAFDLDTASTAQTGDAYARLGAPAGASVSADVAAVKVDTAATLVDTNELQTDWADGGRLDLILDAIEAFLNDEIAQILVDTGTTLDDFVDDLENRLTAALATQLAAHSLGVGRGVVDASSTTTEVIFKTVNGAAASGTNDFYNGRHIVFTSGALMLQATSITDYVGATKTATVPALTGAPAEDVTFVIV